MTTLHDLLKDTHPENHAERDDKRVDLRGRYGKIGLSAVAAGAPYRSKADDSKPDHKTAHDGSGRRS